MDKETFEQVRTLPSHPTTIAAALFADGQDRTLAYGYTCDRLTWHAYVVTSGVAPELHVVVYDHTRDLVFHTSGEVLECEVLRPDKRVYPHLCDAAFAKVMAAAGYPLPFTTFDEERYEATKDDSFHGLVLEGLNRPGVHAH